MPDRHIILRATGKEWRAAYSDQPEDEFPGANSQAAIEALVAAKGRRDPKQSAAQIDIAAMLAKAKRLDTDTPFIGQSSLRFGWSGDGQTLTFGESMTGDRWTVFGGW